MQQQQPQGTHTEQLSRLLISISDKQAEISNLKELCRQRVAEHVALERQLNKEKNEVAGVMKTLQEVKNEISLRQEDNRALIKEVENGKHAKNEIFLEIVEIDGLLKRQIDASNSVQNQAAEVFDQLTSDLIKERKEFKMQMRKILQESQ